MQHFCMWALLPYLQLTSALTMKMQCHDREPQNRYCLHTRGCGIQSRETWGKINQDPPLWTLLLWTSLSLFIFWISTSKNLGCPSLGTSLLVFLHVQNQIASTAVLSSISKGIQLLWNVHFNKRIYSTKWLICNCLQMKRYGEIFWILILPKLAMKMS